MCPKFDAEFHSYLFWCWYKHKQEMGIPTWPSRATPCYLFQWKHFLSPDKHWRKAADSRPLRLGLQQQTDTSTTATPGEFCVVMNCSDSVSPDEEDLRDEGMSFLSRSILTHLGQGSAGAQTGGKSKHGDTRMFKAANKQTYLNFIKPRTF